MNESNSSKKEYHEFFQASQNNMMVCGNNIQNNEENWIRSRAENSPFTKVGNVPNENENVATRENRMLLLEEIDSKLKLS